MIVRREVKTHAKPLRLLLRIAFHDWLWHPESSHPRARSILKHLPTYFTDPYLDGIPKNPAKRREWFESLPNVEATVGPPDLSVSGGFQVVPENSTATSAARFVNLRWTGPAA